MLVALTGGVASGKTRVSDRLGALGAPIVDTDLIARDVVAPGTTGLKEVRQAFGPRVLDDAGKLDRHELRRIVFADSNARTRLESILHPLIEREARRRVADHADADYVVLVVPLLVESGLFRDADRVVVVDVNESTQLERLQARDGIDRDQARAMMDAQASRQDRLALATDVIDNNGDLESLEHRVDALHDKLVALSRRSRGPESP
jgi:dephospho-CoA kinase